MRPRHSLSLLSVLLLGTAPLGAACGGRALVLPVGDLAPSDMGPPDDRPAPPDLPPTDDLSTPPDLPPPDDLTLPVDAFLPTDLPLPVDAFLPTDLPLPVDAFLPTDLPLPVDAFSPTDLLDLATPSDLLPPAPAQPRTDGLFDDWQRVPLLASDAAGDATGAFDVTRVQAQSRGSVLFLRFDTGRTLNLQEGETADGTLRLELDPPRGPHLTIDLRNRRIRAGTQTLFWSDVGFRFSPTHASSDFEVRIDLARFGVTPGSTVRFNFSGSDALAAPVLFTLLGPPLVAPGRSATRQAGTRFRVAALNTLQSGLLDPTRSAAIGRLVRAVAADVYAFQEEYTGTPAEIAQAITALDPTGDGAPWQAYKGRDIALVSRYRLIPVTATQSRHAAVVVEAPAGPVVVIGVHLSCCGYNGSQEDQDRIAEAQAIAGTLAALRGGLLGLALLPYRDAPAMVLGDFNLVGSRTPLDVLTATPGPGLLDWLLLHLNTEDVETWRVLRSSFVPGRLDLVVHSPTLARRNGYVLDSGELDDVTRAALGLLPDDSRASDHLLLVTDFDYASP
jgi:hypothetical protein